MSLFLVAVFVLKLDLHTVATALKTVYKESQSILFTALPKPHLPLNTEHNDTSNILHSLGVYPMTPFAPTPQISYLTMAPPPHGQIQSPCPDPPTHRRVIPNTMV